MIVALIAAPAGLPAVHPFAVRIVDSGAPFRLAWAQHALLRAEKLIGGKQHRCAESLIGQIDVAPPDIGVLTFVIHERSFTRSYKTHRTLSMIVGRLHPRG